MAEPQDNAPAGFTSPWGPMFGPMFGPFAPAQTPIPPNVPPVPPPSGAFPIPGFPKNWEPSFMELVPEFTLETLPVARSGAFIKVTDHAKGSGVAVGIGLFWIDLRTGFPVQ